MSLGLYEVLPHTKHRIPRETKGPLSNPTISNVSSIETFTRQERLLNPCLLQIKDGSLSDLLGDFLNGSYRFGKRCLAGLLHKGLSNG